MNEYLVVRRTGPDQGYAFDAVKAEDGNAALKEVREQGGPGRDDLLVAFSVQETRAGEPYFRREAELHAAT